LKHFKETNTKKNAIRMQLLSSGFAQQLASLWRKDKYYYQTKRKKPKDIRELGESGG